MAKNLAYLPSVVGPLTGSETTPYYYVYGYDGTDVSAAKATSNYTTYGVLYNWPAASTACPIGWHLPTDAEYREIDVSREALVSAGWFNNIFAGARLGDGTFFDAGNRTYFWTSTLRYWDYGEPEVWAWSRWIPKWGHTEIRTVHRFHGESVRCLRD